MLGGQDPVVVTGATPHRLHPMKGWPQTHRRTDVEEPTTKFWDRKVVDGTEPLAKATPAGRPITIKIQSKIIRATHLVIPQNDASLMRAIFSLLFHTCARIGEMVSFNRQPRLAVLAQNVHLEENLISVTFMSFKHHRGCMPETRVMQASRVLQACPAMLIQHYAKSRPGA